MRNIILVIRFVGKPEMAVEEAAFFVTNNFPGAGEVLISASEVHVKLNQEALTDEQRDWLHMTPFAARYIDSYTVEQSPKDSLVFREAIELLTNPTTAKRFAETWNADLNMPWEIDMSDPDAPWNQHE